MQKTVDHLARPAHDPSSRRPAPQVARPARTIPMVALSLLGLACSSATGPDTAPERAASVGLTGACEGRATSLPPQLAATLPPVGSARTPDDRWAELARRVPGGFAGVMYEASPSDGPPRTTGRPIVMLVDPSRAAEAKAALGPHLPGFDVAGADVRAVRWDFAQLHDWYRHLNRGIWQEPGVTMSDIDEAENRIVYGAADEAVRDRILQRLTAMSLPCDLVRVRIVPPAWSRALGR
jgi:hypothetical protein